MQESADLDPFDLRILRLLQEDARLTNQDLAGRVNLSPSQCSRRRTRLERDGIIARYRAELSRERLGFELLVFINVTLATHNRDNARRFAELAAATPAILEAYALTGDMDYLLKAVLPGLAALSTLVNDVLLPHESVQTVRSAIVLDVVKASTALPL